MANDRPSEELLSIRQAAERLDCHPDTVRRAILQGRLEGSKVRGQFGQEWRVSRQALEDYIRADGASDSVHTAAQGSLSQLIEGPMQDLAEGMHKVHRGLEDHTDAEQRRDEVLEGIQEKTEKVHVELLQQLAALRREKDAEIARLEEELAAERRTTWWQRLTRRK